MKEGNEGRRIEGKIEGGWGLKNVFFFAISFRETTNSFAKTGKKKLS